MYVSPADHPQRVGGTAARGSRPSRRQPGARGRGAGMSKRQHSGADQDWTRRIITGEQLGVAQPPQWLEQAYQRFARDVLHPEFPCFFGTNAERRGELYYSYASVDDLSPLPATLLTFIRESRRHEREKNNFAIFFEPTERFADHDEFRSFCWRV